jgi:hypothetical protein
MAMEPEPPGAACYAGAQHPCCAGANRGTISMRVGKPSAIMFIISAVLAALAVLAMLTSIPVVDGHEFLFMFAAWAVLALSTVIRGL